MARWLLRALAGLALVGCAALPREVTVTREVAVTREVEVTRQVEVTRERLVERWVEVTRLVHVTGAEDGAPPVPTHGVIGTPEPHGCWSPAEAGTRIGEPGCVRAVVEGVGSSASAFFINLTADFDGFYLVSFDWLWEGIEGECLVIDGTPDRYQGRPQIIIEDPSQLHYCDSAESPPAFPRAGTP